MAGFRASRNQSIAGTVTIILVVMGLELLHSGIGLALLTALFERLFESDGGDYILECVAIDPVDDPLPVTEMEAEYRDLVTRAIDQGYAILDRDQTSYFRWERLFEYEGEHFRCDASERADR